jgi:hypothetical protein
MREFPYVIHQSGSYPMNPRCLLLTALLLSAATARAGEVYGTITQGNKPVDAGVKVEIAISGKVYTAATDKFGSYRVIVTEKGKCTMTVRLNQATASVPLFSYDKATRYDWILQTTDGKLSLRRK